MRYGLKLATTAALGLMVGGLAGCLREPEPMPAATAAAQPAPGYVVVFTDQDETAKLAHGRPGSDDLDMMFECIKGSRRVEVTFAREPGGADLRLSSGDQRSDFKGRLLDNEMTGGRDLAVNAPLDAPALRGFRDTGRLSAVSPRARADIAASPLEQADVRRFFAACERA